MIQKIAYIDGNCIYQNRYFWFDETNINKIALDFDNHEVLDYRKQPVTDLNVLRTEFSYIYPQLLWLAQSSDHASEIQRNINLGSEIISLFREEYMLTENPGISSLELGMKTGNLMTLLLGGCFKEACQALDLIERDSFLTDELITRYKELITAADAIIYV